MDHDEPLLTPRDRPTAAASRNVLVVVGLAWVAVIGRSLVYVVFEHSLFDSDQAIVGLMAKHLVEGRAFPLFYYGQQYALAVEAWLAAPIFLAFGSSVHTLHVTIALIHLTVVTLMLVGLVQCGVNRWAALIAVLFFALAPDASAARLSEANGVNSEPFLFVLLLWWLRTRPLWFGTVLALGVLAREFTVYAVPALLAAQWLEGAMRRNETIRWWLLAAVACGATFVAVSLLEPFADPMGPGTRHAIRGGPGPGVADRSSVVWSEMPERARVLAGQGVPQLLGASPAAASAPGLRDWMVRLVLVVVGAAFARLVVLCAGWDRDARRRGALGVYLTVIGLASLAGYALTRPAATLTIRYFLLALLLPIGVTALILTFEPFRLARRSVVVVVLVWASFSVWEHVRLFARYSAGREPNYMRDLVDELERRGTRTVASNYWRAYKITFLSGERVKVASSDFIRIQEYQLLAEAEGERLRWIEEKPCPGGEPVATYFLCR